MTKFTYLICLLSILSCNKETVKIPLSLLDSISVNRYYDNEILSKNNIGLYGQWNFSYIYDDAGIIAGPGKINPTYDYLVFKKYGIYGKIKDNKVIESGQIEIVKQDNLYFEINFKPDKPDPDMYAHNTWYVNYKNSDSLIMTDASIGCGVLYHVYKK